jgi:aspartate aminotransferase-like enzyme
MDDKFMLMIPGPTPVPESVLQAQAKHLIGHRSGEFSQIMGDIAENLKWLHQTENDVLMLTASGTGAMEAGIINVLSAGDRVLVGSNGKFGDRWAKVCRAYGLQVDTITAEWGKPLDTGAFQAALEADTAKDIKAVIVTHSETSTGVLNDLETIAKLTKAHGALILVDAVTSLGACSVPVDAWGLDMVASGSQKGYMVPPGLGFVTLSDRAWAAYETSNLPKFYFDLGPYRKGAAKNTTPFTPPRQPLLCSASGSGDDAGRGAGGHLCPPRPFARGHPGGDESAELAPIRSRRCGQPSRNSGDAPRGRGRAGALHHAQAL